MKHRRKSEKRKTARQGIRDQESYTEPEKNFVAGSNRSSRKKGIIKFKSRLNFLRRILPSASSKLHFIVTASRSDSKLNHFMDLDWEFGTCFSSRNLTVSNVFCISGMELRNRCICFIRFTSMNLYFLE